MRDELDRLREWRDGASLTLSGLRQQSEQMRSALKRARGWLKLLTQERPETSDIHAVLAEVDAALASVDGRQMAETEGLGAKPDQRGPAKQETPLPLRHVPIIPLKDIAEFLDDREAIGDEK